MPANDVRMLDRLVVGEEQQDEREDEHAQDLGRHADVVEDRQQPDPERVDERRDHSAVMAMNVCMFDTPSGHGESRNSWPPPVNPAMT